MGRQTAFSIWGTGRAPTGEQTSVARPARTPSELTAIVIAEPTRALLTDWRALVASARRGVEGPVGISTARGIRAGYEPLYVFVRADAELLGGVRLLRSQMPDLRWALYLPDPPVMADEPGPLLASVRRRLAEALMELERQHAGLFLQPP